MFMADLFDLEKGKSLSPKRRAYLRKYYATHKERSHEYYEAHKDKILEYSSAYHKAKTGDPQYASYARFKSRLNAALKRNNNAPVELGTSLSEFMSYIERMFEPGMSWSDRSTWKLKLKFDYPGFDLTDASERAKCFHYSNWFPCWSASGYTPKLESESVSLTDLSSDSVGS